MTESAADRQERMARAMEGRGRNEGPPAHRPTGVRTKPARMTVDMPPALRRRLKAWTGAAARDLDVMDVAGAEVVRILIEMLTATGTDDAMWDMDFTPVLTRRVLDEVGERVKER